MELERITALAQVGELIGVFSDISSEDYHAGPGISNSTQSGLEQSPMHWQFAQSNRKETKAMLEGTLLHEYSLEPHKVDGWVIVNEEVGLLTKDHVKLMAKFPGKRVVPSDVLQNLQQIDVNLKKLPLWQLCIAHGFKELSAYSLCPRTGLLKKARPDVYLPEQKWLVDLKKTQDASHAEFSRSCANFGYYRQGAFHMDVFNEATAQHNKRKMGFEGSDVVTQWIAIACEWQEPWGVHAWVLDNQAIALGTYEYRQNLETIAKCKRDNFHPGYPTEIGTLSLPGWKLHA